MIKAFIVDDEDLGRESMEILLKKYCPDVQVTGSVSSIQEAREFIPRKKPDIVFLDIEMPHGNGFDLLEDLGIIDFEVIFITAYENYAIKAFKYNAVDYLLKPVDPEDLKNALEKVRRKMQAPELQQKDIQKLLEKAMTRPKKLTLSTMESLLFVNLEDIVRLQSDTNYTFIFLVNGEKIIVSRTLKEYENLLTDSDFFRVHNSHIVNLNHISKYIKSENYIEMSDSSKVEVSNRKKPEFMAKLAEFLK